MKSLKILILITLLNICSQKKNYRFNLSKDNTNLEYSSNYSENNFNNEYVVELNDDDLLEENNFFLIFESNNPDFIVSFLDGKESSNLQKSSIYDLSSFNGNSVLVMSDNFLNKKLKFFKDSGKMKFVIKNTNPEAPNLDYKIKIQVQKILRLELGKSYKTKLDSNIETLPIDLFYNGKAQKNLKKLRFQITSIRQKPDYFLTSDLIYKGSTYQMNNIFKKSVGGILSLPDLPVCLETLCNYRLNTKLKNVQKINIESNLISEIETLDIQHYEEYYDRTYKENTITTYKLPYLDEIEGLDISICLIPVTNDSGLFVNAKTKPMDIEKSDWKEKGPLAKRITIKWEELVEMKAEKSDLFINVRTAKPGEYLVKIDAHESNYQGRLNSGITEAGFVKFNELNKYLYLFTVYESQKISFNLRMNIISGDADLYLKQCSSLKNCKADLEDLESDELVKLENNQSIKEMNHTFQCNVKHANKGKDCHFLIIVKGKENHGTHFDLALKESYFHRLMLPGHSVPLRLNKNELTFLKFSYPHSKSNSTLHLSVENVYGSFKLYLSKKNEKPDKDNSDLTKIFHSKKAGLLNSLENIEMNSKTIGTGSLQGIYYIAIESDKACSLNLKFYEKNVNEKDNKVSLHTLTAGNQTRGEITNNDEVLYYTIKLSLDKDYDQTRLNLTALKGDFIIFANHNGKLPTKENNAFYSEDHHLILPLKNNEEVIDEYIIGVQLTEETKLNDNSAFQFIISFNYSSKPLLLIPGILSYHILQKKNYFLIEVNENMNDLLILRTIEDGYNSNMCVKFSSANFMENKKEDDCDFTAKEKKLSIYIPHEQLINKCLETSGTDKCNIVISLTGNKNHQLTIGYTYNNLPFTIIKGKAFMAPSPENTKTQLNFIYHPETDKPLGLFFDGKGQDLEIYTKLVKIEDYSESTKLVFPSVDDYDKKYLRKDGYIRNVLYPADYLSTFDTPELLITVKTNKNIIGDNFSLNNDNGFLFQIFSDAEEIVRTHTKTVAVIKNEWSYFTFYNNGNTKNLRIYINSSGADRLEAILSRGLQSRPPLTSQGIVKKNDIGALIFDLKGNDLVDENKNKNAYRGHFTLAVKSDNNTKLNIFWNNKEDLNYIELTPNKETSMFLENNRNFYFSFFTKGLDGKKKGKIIIYIRTNVQSNFWILKSEKNEMEAPSESHYTWKSTTAKMGGVTAIEILPDDPDYCISCTYIGHVQSNDDGKLSILVDIEHDNIPIPLEVGTVFPGFLEPGESKKYKLFNPDSDLIDLTVSMMGGGVDVYVSAEEDVSDKKYKELHSLQSSLEIHKFIVIAPSVKYDIREAHDFYLYIKNPKEIPASYTLNLDKNTSKNPIQPGIRKFFHLAPGETTDFYYTPTSSEDKFEIQLELNAVFNKKFKSQAISLIDDYMDIYHISKFGDRYKLKYNNKSIEENRLYIDFDISNNTSGTFTIHIYNPVGSGVGIYLDVLNGGYKLLHLNEHSISNVPANSSKIYEAYGEKGKYFYFDLKMCMGDVDVSFYESDYQNVEGNKNSKYKTLKSANSFTHFLKINHSRVFLKIKNKGKTGAVFDMDVYNRRNLDSDPFSEVSLKNEGKVIFDTDSNTVSFDKLQIKSNYSEKFYHSVHYIVYLSESFEIMRYAKNCGNFMLKQNFEETKKKDNLFFIFEKKLDFDAIDSEKHQGKILIDIGNLDHSVKYYGIVVANIYLYPKDLGLLTPIRENKVYYDEFIFISSKYQIPIVYILGLSISFGVILMLFFIVKSYVFGRIREFKSFERISDWNGFEEVGNGMDIMQAMESEFFEEMKREEEKEEAEGKEEEVEETLEEKIENEEKIKEIELSQI